MRIVLQMAKSCPNSSRLRTSLGASLRTRANHPRVQYCASIHALHARPCARYFSLILKLKNLQNIRRELHVIIKIYSTFFWSFLRKCAGGSLVSAQPLCSVDDAIDQTFESSA